MALTDYTGHNETIKLKFGLSFRYMVIQTFFWLLLFGLLTFIAPQSSIIQGLLAAMMSLILLYLWIIFWTTTYFITETKIYKKTGVIWTKLIESGKEDVTDITIQKTLLDRLIYGTGTIKLNTAGGPKIELILEKVDNPEMKKKEIFRIWKN